MAPETLAKQMEKQTECDCGAKLRVCESCEAKFCGVCDDGTLNDVVDAWFCGACTTPAGFVRVEVLPFATEVL